MKKPNIDDQIIVFTDLDGTLLDHETYSYAAALPALDELKQCKIPLILASSKTAAEISPLRESLGFAHCPAIVENGAGIIAPHQTTGTDGSRYDDILAAIDSVPAELRMHYKSFSNWTAEEVSQVTGLSLNGSTLAKDRQFSEPGLWSGNEDEWHFFKELIGERGLIAQQGGRFRTLSFGGNKADRVKEIAKDYAKIGLPTFSIALGDAGNDIAMLEAANLGFIIANDTHGGIPELMGEGDGSIIREPGHGPVGWHNAVMSILG